MEAKSEYVFLLVVHFEVVLEFVHLEDDAPFSVCEWAFSDSSEPVLGEVCLSAMLEKI